MKSSAKSAARKTIARRPKREDTRQIDTHVKLVGEVVWAWNELHRSLAMAFFDILDCPNPFMGHTIWGALGDRQQRDILVAAVHADGFGGPVRKRILWAVAATNKLAVYRNDFVHTAMGRGTGADGKSLPPSHIGTPVSRVLRMHSVGAIRALRALKGDLTQLSEYVMRIVWKKHVPEKHPSWPRKPRLRTPKVCPPIHWPEDRRRKRRARKRQQPSSPP